MSYWAEDGAELTCTFPVTGIIPDFGMLGVKATLCEGVEEVPADIGEFQGPVTGWASTMERRAQPMTARPRPTMAAKATQATTVASDEAVRSAMPVVHYRCSGSSFSESRDVDVDTGSELPE